MSGMCVCVYVCVCSYPCAFFAMEKFVRCAWTLLRHVAFPANSDCHVEALESATWRHLRVPRGGT